MLHRFILALMLAAPTGWASILTLYPVNNPAVPGNVLAGNGQTLGWGVKVENDASGWLVIDSVVLQGDPAPVGTAGDFADLLSVWVANNSYAFAPSETKTIDWAAGVAGFAEFTFPSSAVGYLGPTVPVQVTYDVFDGDPFNSSYSVDTPGSTTVNVTLNESGPSIPPEAPEPGTAALVPGALAAVWAARKIR